MTSNDQLRNVKGMSHTTAPLTEEEKAEMQTPADTKQPQDQEIEDPGESLDGCSSDGCDDDKSCRDEEDYYAFLREMAGSFEATYDDEDESDAGSETDAEVEENDQPGSRKRSSSFWLDPRPGISSTSASGPSAHTAQQNEADGSKDSESKAIQMTSAKGTMGTGGPKAVSGQLRELPSKKVVPGSARPGSALTGYSTSTGSASSPSEGYLSELSDDEDARSEASSDDTRPLVPTPSHDHRPPVEDDYDVVEAAKHFASQRTADPKQQQREDLQSMIEMKESQVKQLQRTSKKPHTKLELRVHYAKVCDEIETEVAELRKSLVVLG